MSTTPGPNKPFVAPPPSPADVGIVAALPIEIAPFRSMLKAKRTYAGKKLSIIEGEVGGKIVALAIGGMGRARAEYAARCLMDGHRPRWVISAGFAGALTPLMPRNSILLADQVVNIEGHRFKIDVKTSAPDGPKIGTLLTVDEIIRTSAEKRELAKAHDAVAVDMETSSVAALCGERGQRFLSIRVISDDAGHDLPPEVLSILGPSGGFRLGATIGSLWKRPSAIKDLLRLREHAVQASDVLANFLVETLPHLS